MTDKMPVPKPVDKEGARTQLFNTSVTKIEGDKFREKMKRDGYNASELIRFWIKTYINQKK